MVNAEKMDIGVQSGLEHFDSSSCIRVICRYLLAHSSDGLVKLEYYMSDGKIIFDFVYASEIN